LRGVLDKYRKGNKKSVTDSERSDRNMDSILPAQLAIE
jgi:hypothetical protein